MSRIDEETGQPHPSRERFEEPGTAQESGLPSSSSTSSHTYPAPSPEPPPEPRLLTRQGGRGSDPASLRTKRRQHLPEAGIAAWAGQLARRRRARPAAETALLARPDAGVSPGEVPVSPEPRLRSRLPSRRGAARLLAILAGVGFVLLCAAALVVLNLRHALHASLPQLDGEIHIGGLHAPVTVTRDAQGVPTITAANLDDLLFAQGYVTAGDRLWQMDGLRRHAAGELAEILGPGLVEHDRLQRYLQVRAAADRAVAELPRDQYAQLEAYARGVNAFIDSHRSSLPMEFHLLAYKPAPWSPRDSLLVSLAIYQDMSTGFPQKLNREALSAHVPGALLSDLYPVGSWRDLPPEAQGRNITAPHDVEQIPLDRSQSRLRQPPPADAQPRTSALDLLALSGELAGAGRCEGCRAGSNNWAVSGAHTASGGPLLSNDMHLNLGIPDTWYEASLHADLLGTEAPGSRLDVTGFTLPGIPFVIVGRNTHVAWGLTNLGADVEDLRVEHLRGTGADTEYERPDGTWALARHRGEQIRVRGGRDVTLDILSTDHALGEKTMETPIISPLYPTEKRALSLAWTAYDPATITSPFLAINTAADGSALVASFSALGGPTLNLVWADDNNHIGYHALGRIPIRGLAVQHPRAAPPAADTSEPKGALPPDEGDDPNGGQSGDGQPAAEESSPQAALPPVPHWTLSAYRPQRHRQRPTPRVAAAPAPARGRRAHRRPPVVTPLPLATEPQTEALAPPTPSAPNYTIGSPLSPAPVDALDTSQVWSGYISYADLPEVRDPAKGLLATANSRITPDGYPWAVTTDWVDPFRTERVVHLLNGRRGLTPADMLRLQIDVHSDVDQAIAHRVAYALDHASAQALRADSKRLKQAADLLREWDGEVVPDSPAAAVASAVRSQLWPALLIPQILAHDAQGNAPRDVKGLSQRGDAQVEAAGRLALLYTASERTTALELLLQHQPARWLPRPYTRWSDFLAAVTENALQLADAPRDLTKWRYGKLHTVEIEHPLLGDQHLLSTLLGIRSTTGPQPAAGDATTVRQIGSHFGPSERFTADLASPGAAFANLTTGQSEVPLSPWYLDQFRPWLEGTTFPLPLDGAARSHTVRLLPQ